MLAILSPAKTLDYESELPPHSPTEPEFLDQSEELIRILRKKSGPELQALMGISKNLAELNRDRFRSWSRPFSEDNARAALLAFKGDVYTGFDFSKYRKMDFQFAQKQMRILSGLYGLLRPMDLMQPYRLEMGTSLKNPKGKNLYEFWGPNVTEALQGAIKKSGSNVLVNLASKEYFSAVDTDLLDAEIVTPQFKDLKKDTYKIISFYAKKARGSMCDFMITERIKHPEELKRFEVDGYRFNPKLTKGQEWVFTRDKPPTSA